VSASLRNARFGRGSEAFCADIAGLSSKESVLTYLVEQTKLRAEDHFKATRSLGLKFDEAYESLRRAAHDRGLSNSEAALAAGLWGATQAGATIRHCALAQYFPASGVHRRLDELRADVLGADAILLSGPVYFGDRGSLAQEFIEFLREDPACSRHVRGRVYGGITVGAKRNGGQETTLIYQMIDLANLHMLVVGNDDETTSQYGGTAVAGDVGTLAADSYGIQTSIGTGRRVARVAAMLDAGAQMATSNRSTRIAIWLLQDDVRGTGLGHFERVAADILANLPGVEVEISDFTSEMIYRCLACDICPTHAGDAEDYRCIISAERDLFRTRHASLIQPDAILLAAYSPVDRSQVRSSYQRFVERTRYLRRDDYVFKNVLTAPLVVSEVDSNQNLHIRMMTSFIRHLTIVHHPVLGIEYQGALLNRPRFTANAIAFAQQAIRCVAGRRAIEQPAASYQPMGYVISAEKSAAARRPAGA
jgi:multimeric flavodoxin WrbA